MQTKLVEKKEIVDHLSDKLSLPINSSDQSVLISGRGAENTEIFFGSISGEIYVGGVLGYNDENTKLTIQNVENATAIEVTNAIEYKAEQIRGERRTRCGTGQRKKSLKGAVSYEDQRAYGP